MRGIAFRVSLYTDAKSGLQSRSSDGAVRRLRHGGGTSAGRGGGVCCGVPRVLPKLYEHHQQHKGDEQAEYWTDAPPVPGQNEGTRCHGPQLAQLD